MSNQPERENFGSTELLIAFIKEKTDDLEKVVILPPGARLRNKGETVYVEPDFSMMLYFIDGNRKQIFRHDTEILLNDGILSRMKIKIEFLK